MAGGLKKERVLGSTNMQPSTKLFTDGDYRFPVEGDSTQGYIEARNITFNTSTRRVGLPRGSPQTARELPVGVVGIAVMLP